MAKKIEFIKVITLIVILVILLISFLASYRYVVYFYERVVMSNSPTILISCNDFRNKEVLEQVLNSNLEELQIIKKYLSEIDGEITINKVRRCGDLFQFEITFGSEKNRIELLKILKDQRIQGIPVFLRNV